MNVAEQALAFANRWPRRRERRRPDRPLDETSARAELAQRASDPRSRRCPRQKRAWMPIELTIEITESSLLRNEETALSSMHQLRELGAHLSIDDFGTGYSSLSRLSEFPIELLKIPKPFRHAVWWARDGDELFVDAHPPAGRVAPPRHRLGRRSSRFCSCSVCCNSAGALAQGFLFSRPLGGTGSARPARRSGPLPRARRGAAHDARARESPRRRYLTRRRSGPWQRSSLARRQLTGDLGD